VTFYFNLESLVLPDSQVIPFIHRLPGLSSVMFGDVRRCSTMFGDVRAMFGDVRRYYPRFGDVRRYSALSELQFTIAVHDM